MSDWKGISGGYPPQFKDDKNKKASVDFGNKGSKASGVPWKGIKSEVGANKTDRSAAVKIGKINNIKDARKTSIGKAP
jgi:hypothetical protein